MRNGIIAPVILRLWNNLQEKWNDSFFASIKNRLGGFLIRGLENSLIVSSILDYRSKIYSRSLIKKLIRNIIEFIRKILFFINKLFRRPIKQSMTFNISNYIIGTIMGNLFQFLCTTLGTGILTYSFLGFATGRVGILKLAVFLSASFVLGFLGFARIDVKVLLSESKFATIFRNFFDYYS